MRRHARSLAALAVEETGLGRVEDKIQKNLLVTNKTPGPEELVPQATSGDHGLVLIEPRSVRRHRGDHAGDEPVVHDHLQFHRHGRRGQHGRVQRRTPRRRGSRRRRSAFSTRRSSAAGGPPNVVACMAEPTIESAGELMKHPRIRLLVVTGGGAVVAAAMDSGKSAICAGPGQPSRRRRRNGRRREGRSRRRLRPLVRQQRHLRGREGGHRRRVRRRRPEGRDEEGRRRRAPARAICRGSRR